MVDRAMQRLSEANPVTGEPSPEAVGALVQRWEEAALLDGPSRDRRWRDRLATWLASGLLIAVVGTASAAAALTALTGSPLPSGTDAFTVSPAPGTTRLSPVRAQDPDGGPPWAVRVGTAEAGLVCLGVGQVQAGQLGLVGLDGVFRAVPPAGADDCGAPPVGRRSTVQTRTFLGEPRSNSVTVIYGLRAPEATGVLVRYADGVAKALQVGPDGSFIVARRGNLAAQHPEVVFPLRPDANGHRAHTVDLAPSSAAPRRRGQQRPLVPSEAPR